MFRRNLVRKSVIQTNQKIMATGGQQVRTSKAQQTPCSSDIEFWKETVSKWYHEWQERTFFVPAVQMNHTHYITEKVSGIDVDVPQCPVSKRQKGDPPGVHESNVTSDRATQRVRHCLRELSEGEVMFVIFDLKFEDYLAATVTELPIPMDLKEQDKERGDFDVLIIHKTYGILACEIKSVGSNFQTLSEPKQLERLEKKVKRAIAQLDKAGDVLSHLVSDMSSQPRIRKALILTHISASLLRKFLAKYPQLSEDLSQCLGVPGSEDPVPFCVTSDHLSNSAKPHVIPDDVLQQLRQWWQTRVTGEGADPVMSPDLYLDLLARFVGPATTYRVFCTTCPPLSMDLARTEGEGASETGNRFTRLVLTPRQTIILDRTEPLVFLTGPPGVGKSVMLLLKAMHWLSGEKHVEVLSTWPVSLAASHNVHYQLQQMKAEDAQRIHFHEFDLRDAQGRQNAVTALETSSRRQGGGELYIIVDEMCYGDDGQEQPFEIFANDLLKRGDVQAKHLHMWVACMRTGRTPSITVGGTSPDVKEFSLDIPLRTPPSITREVQKSNRMGTHQNEYVKGYTQPDTPQPTDGLQVSYLYHSGPGHNPTVSPQRCECCGENVARELTERFHVGKDVRGGPSSGSGPSSRGRPSSQLPLEFKDVFVLTADLVSDRDCLVVGLRQGGRLPVTVLPSGDSRAAADVATMTQNEVVVADYKDVHGLERKVVVWVQKYVTSRDREAQLPDEQYGRMYAMSRSSGHLVCVVPGAPHQNP